jgi:hypothetical protein
VLLNQSKIEKKFRLERSTIISDCLQGISSVILVFEGGNDLDRVTLPVN